MLREKEANVCLKYIENIGDLGCLSTDMEDVHHENMQMNIRSRLARVCRDWIIVAIALLKFFDFDSRQY